MYMYGYDVTYWLFMIPPLIIMIFAQISVKSAFSKYSKIQNSRGMTGAAAAQSILSNNGITNVQVVPTNGKLSDHYDPSAHVIRLSEEVYNSSTIAAVGIAAHEAGHAVQHAEGYAPLKLRSAMVPLARFSPMVSIVLLMIGFILDIMGLVWLAIGLFAVVFVFQLVTLPVEFDASRRALASIDKFGLLSIEEAKGAKRVLSAAAMTYVAAMLQSLMQVLYYILRATSRRR